jgi:hypothetical protein
MTIVVTSLSLRLSYANVIHDCTALLSLLHPPRPSNQQHTHRANHLLETFDPSSSSSSADAAAAAAAAAARDWEQWIEQDRAGALASVLQLHLAGDSDDAQSALELLNDTLQEVCQQAKQQIWLLKFSVV